MTCCEYLIRVELSQSQSQAAYFENFAESIELQVELRQYPVQVCMLYDADETSRLVQFFDNFLIISRLSTAVSKADYLARDLIKPLEILCDVCGHRTNVSLRLK